jgi:hypothetical protein
MGNRVTADQKFLHDNHIEPCEIRLPAWMTWREDELDGLRAANQHQAEWLGSLDSERKRWKACAILGWLFAAMLFSIPLIDRIGQ